MVKVTTAFLVFGLISAGTVYYFFPDWIIDPEIPKLESFQWWGKGNAPAGAEKAPIISKPFKIQVKQPEIEDLKRRLAATRYSEPLENVNFQYGFPGDQLKKVVDYWIHKYDWSVHEAALNKFDHFKANIEGIDIHYMRSTPKPNKNVKVFPLLLIHGWPGSIVEFLKIIPLLTTPRPKQDFVFDVICPSIPGYGYSEAPHQSGFNGPAAARIFHKLMTSIISKTPSKQYYVQGGDWGSFISTIMGAVYPERIRGVHLNMISPKTTGPRFLASLLFGQINPSLVLDEGQTKSYLPFPSFFGNVILETGYLHIQATKPDTVGSALSDSPAGLAAYILEKFSSLTNMDYRDLPDGGLTKKFTLDELLTNIMVYWTTNTITSSTRFYKENFKSPARTLIFTNLPLKVPVGVALFPNEIYVTPRAVAQDTLRNIITYTHHKRGGHFAAFEEPELLADDIIKFVKVNEKLIRAKENISS